MTVDVNRIVEAGMASTVAIHMTRAVGRFPPRKRKKKKKKRRR